jgi:hypothetical protein
LRFDGLEEPGKEQDSDRGLFASQLPRRRHHPLLPALQQTVSGGVNAPHLKVQQNVLGQPYPSARQQSLSPLHGYPPCTLQAPLQQTWPLPQVLAQLPLPAAQLSQEPQLALAQQTPSTQFPLAHCRPWPQALPLACAGTHSMPPQ